MVTSAPEKFSKTQAGYIRKLKPLRLDASFERFGLIERFWRGFGTLDLIFHVQLAKQSKLSERRFIGIKERF